MFLVWKIFRLNDSTMARFTHWGWFWWNHWILCQSPTSPVTKTFSLPLSLFFEGGNSFQQSCPLSYRLGNPCQAHQMVTTAMRRCPANCLAAKNSEQCGLSPCLSLPPPPSLLGWSFLSLRPNSRMPLRGTEPMFRPPCVRLQLSYRNLHCEHNSFAVFGFPDSARL